MSDKDVDILKRDVQKILNYLHNDNGTGQKGLVAKVDELQLKVDSIITKDKENASFLKGASWVWGIVGGGVAIFLKWIASLLINNLH